MTNDNNQLRAALKHKVEFLHPSNDKVCTCTVQVGSENTYGQVHTHTHICVCVCVCVYPVKILTSLHRNLISYIITAPALVTCVINWQYSSVTFVSLYFHSHNEKFSTHLMNVTCF